MFSLYGTGVGKGYAIGHVRLFGQVNMNLPSHSVAESEIEPEIQGFLTAVEEAGRELQRLVQDVENLTINTPNNIIGLIRTHALMLEDPTILDEIQRLIRVERHNAVWATKLATDNLLKIFNAIEDPYLRSKDTDIQQVTRLLYRHLIPQQDSKSGERIGDDKIIVCEDLTPADAIVYLKKRVAGMVISQGGPISHTAILVKNMQVAAVLGLHGGTQYLREGDLVIVDSVQGVVTVNPDTSIIHWYRNSMRAVMAEEQTLLNVAYMPSISRDATEVRLLCNVDSSDSVLSR